MSYKCRDAEAYEMRGTNTAEWLNEKARGDGFSQLLRNKLTETMTLCLFDFEALQISTGVLWIELDAIKEGFDTA